MEYRGRLRPLAPKPLIVKPLAPKIENIEEWMVHLGYLVKKKELRTFSYESFLTAEDCNEVTFENFLTAAHQFGAYALDASGDDLRGYLTHLAFMCKMAATEKYDQHMHVAYDKAIRLHAEEIGWSAFKASIASIATLFYGTEKKEQQENEVDQVDSDSDHCGFENTVMSDEQESNEPNLCASPEILKPLCEKESDHTIHRKEPEMKLSGTDTFVQCPTISTEAGLGTQSIKIEDCTKEIPVVEQITKSNPPVRQEGKNKGLSILKPRIVSSPVLVNASPSYTPSKKAPACSSNKMKTRSILISKSSPSPVVVKDGPRNIQPVEASASLSLVSNNSKARSILIARNISSQEAVNNKPTDIPFGKASASPVAEQMTECMPPVIQKSENRARSILRPMKVSRPGVVNDGPTYTSSGEAAACSSVVANDNKARSILRPRKVPSQVVVKDEATHTQSGQAATDEKALSVLISRRGSTPVVLINSPIAIQPAEPSTCISVEPNNIDSKLQEARLPQKRPTFSRMGKPSPQTSRLKSILRRRIVPKDDSSEKFIMSADRESSLLASAKRHVCSQCGKRFSWPSLLRKHLKKHTEKTLVCSYCTKCFSSASKLRAHTQIHTQERSPTRSHQCTHCDRKYARPCQLKAHMRKHTGETPYSCTQCDAKFIRSELLKNHMDKHSGITHICSYCNLKLSSARALKTHVMRHTEGPPTGNKLCSWCGKKFRSLPDLEVHVRNHTGERPFSCNKCESRFISKKNLDTHMHTHAEKKFICSYCGKLFTSKQLLNCHTRIHTGEKPYECSYCGKAFRSSSFLGRHKRTHTGEKPFTCSECGDQFSVGASLRKHKLIHSDERPHECPHCSKTFKEKSLMKAHIKALHTQEGRGNSAIVPKQELNTCSVCRRQFRFLSTLKVHISITHMGGHHLTCPECGKKCGSPRNLQFHMMTHTGEEPFECSDCGKKFFQPGNFHRHQKIHTGTGEKPHACTYCDVLFSQQADLETHIKTHTGDKPYVCLDCGRTFSMTSYMRRHKRLHCQGTRAEQQS